jgi:hypothetical protein
MLEVIVAFLSGLSIGLVVLAIYMKRQNHKSIPVFFDENRYAKLQKDLNETIEKIRNIG